jgi:hypothetical protein
VNIQGSFPVLPRYSNQVQVAHSDWREHKAGKPTQGRVSSWVDLAVRGNAKTPERFVR